MNCVHSISAQHTAFNQASHWLNRVLVLELIRNEIRLPDKWRLTQLTILRVYPAKNACFGAQYHLSLRHPEHGAVHASIYLSANSMRVRRKSCNPRIIPRSTFVLTGLSLPISDGNLLLHTPDKDPHMPDLRIATSARVMTRRLKLDYRPRCACLSYRPGRRCTLAYVDEQRPDRFVVGKIFSNGIYDTTPVVHRRVRAALRSEGACAVEVPRPLRSLADLRMVVFSGVRMTKSAGREGLPDAAGLVLATLHKIQGVSGRHFDHQDEAHTVERWRTLAERLGQSSPMPHRLRAWLQRAARNLPQTRRVFLHRDFYDSQLIATPRGWAVVDLDTACVGDRELDVANFISHHLWNGVQAQSLARARLESVAFLRSYLQKKSGVHRLNARRLQYYLVCSLTRVSLIHSLRTGQETSAKMLMHVAEEFAMCSARRCYQQLVFPQGVKT
jgi:thiamine kinase-like enzyme